MNISELSRLSGLNTPTIRYYEQIKLLPKAKRQANGYREYSDIDLQQLLLIKQAQQAGFSLAEIKSLLPKKDLPGKPGKELPREGLPENLSRWNHDKLIESLSHKVSEIEALGRKLAENKQHLLSLIQAINNKPDDVSCEENAERLFKAYFPDLN